MKGNRVKHGSTFYVSCGREESGAGGVVVTDYLVLVLMEFTIPWGKRY